MELSTLRETIKVQIDANQDNAEFVKQYKERVYDESSQRDIDADSVYSGGGVELISKVKGEPDIDDYYIKKPDLIMNGNFKEHNVKQKYSSDEEDRTADGGHYKKRIPLSEEKFPSTFQLYHRYKRIKARYRQYQINKEEQQDKIRQQESIRAADKGSLKSLLKESANSFENQAREIQWTHFVETQYKS